MATIDYSNSNQKMTLDLSYVTFVRLVVILFLLVFLYLVRDLLLMIFVAIVIASGLDPIIDFFQKKKVPRTMTILFIFAIFVGLLFLIVYVLIPPIVQQAQQLINVLPQYFQIILDNFSKNYGPFNIGMSNIEEFAKSLTGRFGEIVTNIYSAFSNLLSGVIALVIILVLSFYFTVEEDSFKKFIRSITPTKHRPYVEDLVERLQKQIGLWLRGQVTLGLIVGTLIFIGLTLLDVKYALVLALLAAIFGIVPYIGPIIAAIPAIFLAFNQSPLTGLLAVGLYILVQQFENYLLAPRVMEKTSGLNPLIIVLIILVGGKLAGVLGVILAVPLAMAIQVFLKDIFEQRDAREVAKLQRQICPVLRIAEEGLTSKEIEHRRELQKIICPISENVSKAKKEEKSDKTNPK
jgi:predicted PurR-regulated permease PerM